MWTLSLFTRVLKALLIEVYIPLPYEIYEIFRVFDPVVDFGVVTFRLNLGLAWTNTQICQIIVLNDQEGTLITKYLLRFSILSFFIMQTYSPDK